MGGPAKAGTSGWKPLPLWQRPPAAERLIQMRCFGQAENVQSLGSYEAAEAFAIGAFLSFK